MKQEIKPGPFMKDVKVAPSGHCGRDECTWFQEGEWIGYSTRTTDKCAITWHDLWTNVSGQTERSLPCKCGFNGTFDVPAVKG